MNKILAGIFVLLLFLTGCDNVEFSYGLDTSSVFIDDIEIKLIPDTRVIGVWTNETDYVLKVTEDNSVGIYNNDQKIAAGIFYYFGIGDILIQWEDSSWELVRIIHLVDNVYVFSSVDSSGRFANLILEKEIQRWPQKKT